MDYETLSSAAARLGASADTVARWIDTGKLKGIRPAGRGPRIALTEDVDRLARERRGQK